MSLSDLGIRFYGLGRPCDALPAKGSRCIGSRFQYFGLPVLPPALLRIGICSTGRACGSTERYPPALRVHVKKGDVHSFYLPAVAEDNLRYLCVRKIRPSSELRPPEIRHLIQIP
jgi:hypothetical protein